MSSSPLLMSSAFSYLPPPAMPIAVRAHTCAPAHTHPSPLRHTPTTTSATQPAGKMEGAISLHFLHFSSEVRGGSSRAGKSFHYAARRLDNTNKLDGSGADEKQSDRTNRGKKGRETNSNIRQKTSSSLQSECSISNDQSCARG